MQTVVTPSAGPSRSAAAELDWAAREIHDAVGHHVSLIAMQAGIALHLLDQQPDRGKDALEAIRQLSHELLVEMGGVLGVLRGRVEPSPAQGVARIEELAADTRSVGLAVTLEIGTTVRALPPSVQAAAHRIVREALTNVRRHARASHVWLSVSRDRAGLRLTIDDDGSGGAAGEGHGLAGMRERATAVGGSLTAGPRPGGGFRVSARLPITAVPPLEAGRSTRSY